MAKMQAGFCTVYRFYAYPDSQRMRVSQFLVLPPYQGIGLGTHLLEVCLIFRHVLGHDPYLLCMRPYLNLNLNHKLYCTASQDKFLFRPKCNGLHVEHMMYLYHTGATDQQTTLMGMTRCVRPGSYHMCLDLINRL